MLKYLKNFILYLQKSNYSVETIYNYKRDLKTFDFYLKNIIKKDFDSIKKIDIDNYSEYLRSSHRLTSENNKTEKKLSKRSINRILSSLKKYLSFLEENQYNTPVSSTVVKQYKINKSANILSSHKDLIRLIESPTTFEKKREVSLRNRAMLEVLFSTGLRISELVNLNRDQIDCSGKIFVMGKGKKERFVYLTERAKEHLKNYVSLRKDESPALFVPYRGRNVSTTHRRISINYLQDKIKHYRERLKINVPTSAHSLRHGFATYLAESGANPAAIQILLGHESLDTTTRYVHASDRYAEKTLRKYHPLRKK